MAHTWLPFSSRIRPMQTMQKESSPLHSQQHSGSPALQTHVLIARKPISVHNYSDYLRLSHTSSFFPMWLMPDMEKCRDLKRNNLPKNFPLGPMGCSRIHISVYRSLLAVHNGIISVLADICSNSIYHCMSRRLDLTNILNQYLKSCCQNG